MGLMIVCGVTTSLCTLTTELLNTAWQFSAKKAQVLNWTMKGMCTRFISSRIIKHRTWLSQPSLTELLQSASQILYFSRKWRSTGWQIPHPHIKTLGVRKTLLIFQLFNMLKIETNHCELCVFAHYSGIQQNSSTSSWKYHRNLQKTISPVYCLPLW